MYYNDLEREEINGKINSFFRYFNIDPSTLTQKEKLKFLIEKKISLEADMDLFYDYATRNQDKDKVNEYLSRVEVDQLTIEELNQCIHFMRCEIHDNKKNLFKSFKKKK